MQCDLIKLIKLIKLKLTGFHNFAFSEILLSVAYKLGYNFGNIYCFYNL